MDDEEMLFGVVFFIIVAVLAIFICAAYVEATTPPIPINADDIYRYDGYFVQTNVTVEKQITERSEFEFFIMIPIIISAGKTTVTTWVFVPIYDDYYVYKTTNGFIVATDKDHGIMLDAGREYTVCGDVVHDRDNEHLFAIKVKALCP